MKLTIRAHRFRHGRKDGHHLRIGENAGNGGSIWS